MALSKSYRVFEKPGPPTHSVLLEHRHKNDTLLFESLVVAVLSPQEVEVIKKQYTKVCDAYGCLGVLQFTIGENTVLFLVLVSGCFSVGKIGDSEIFRITQTTFISLQHQTPNDERISEVRKLLNSGTFYFSWTSGDAQPMDITLCAQRWHRTKYTDNRFFWNRMLHVHMRRFGIDTDSWLLKAMCGSVEIRTVYISHIQAKAALISRLSCERAGTRFNVRGTNDDGHVANFVETEQVIFLDKQITSYIQTRGSVPLFWEQPGVQVGSHKVRLSRGFACSAIAFDRHMSLMKKRYGKQAIVNLLGTSLIGSKEGEAMLSNEFQKHHSESKFQPTVPHIVFDYHQECRGGNIGALSKLGARIAQFSKDISIYYVNDNNIQSTQKGTIRTNCLDCLDRTNCVQTYIGLEILQEQLKMLQIPDRKQTASRFDEIYKQMWIINGNEVSKIYAGTGAIQGGSKLMDGARSAARTIQNNLLDNYKQEAIDIFLFGSTLNSELLDRARNLLPFYMLHAPTPVLREICKRSSEFLEPQTFRVAVGTYNVNGGKHFRSLAYKDVSLSDWLLDSHNSVHKNSLVNLSHPEESEVPIDIFAVGFEEMVDLNASNIIAASSDNAKAWAEELTKVLSKEHPYSLLTYQQLVGVCLYVFIRPEHAPYVKDVAVDCVKTGLGGATGNKGAAAIRLVLHGTTVCFVCAHFAAGQSQVSERNADYAEITRKITFPMGRTLNSHEYVFWCGDFNYRIDMDKEELKECISQGQLDVILENDQLKKQQEAGNVFKNFLEGPITFPPTYKYDLFSDDYDTSEKCRAPAYTDRVLWKRRRQITDSVEGDNNWSPGKLIHYGRAELKQSDHRPVIALIDVEVSKINDRQRKDVFRKVLLDLGPPDGTICLKFLQDENDDSASVFDQNLIEALIQEISKIGEIILVRYCGDTLWMTFRNGQVALAAASLRTLTVLDVTLSISLRSPDWVNKTEKEIELCADNTVCICDETPEYNQLGIPETTAKPQRPQPPSRPPLPKSPVFTKKVPQAGVFSITPSTVPQARQRPPPPSNLNSNMQNDVDTNAIYEEINEEEVSYPVPQGPPPPPPPSRTDAYEVPIDSPPSRSPPQSAPPPLPQRHAPPIPQGSPAHRQVSAGVPPPVPARSAGPPPLPARPVNQ